MATAALVVHIVAVAGQNVTGRFPTLGALAADCLLLVAAHDRDLRFSWRRTVACESIIGRGHRVINGLCDQPPCLSLAPRHQAIALPSDQCTAKNRTPGVCLHFPGLLPWRRMAAPQPTRAAAGCRTTWAAAYIVQPVRNVGVSSLVASEQLVNCIFSASHSSFCPAMRMAIMPSRPSSLSGPP